MQRGHTNPEFGTAVSAGGEAPGGNRQRSVLFGPVRIRRGRTRPGGTLPDRTKNFPAMDGNASRGLDPELDLISTYLENSDRDVITNHDLLIASTTQDKHHDLLVVGARRGRGPPQGARRSAM